MKPYVKCFLFNQIFSHNLEAKKMQFPTLGTADFILQLLFTTFLNSNFSWVIQQFSENNIKDSFYEIGEKMKTKSNSLNPLDSIVEHRQLIPLLETALL